MPSWPMAMPSSTAIVLNSLATPPAFSISRATSCPRSLRCTWPGTNWVNELATAMIGLPKSASFMPVARHRPRAPAMLRPWVVVRERYCGMGRSRWSGKRMDGARISRSVQWPVSILKDLDLFNGDEPARHHLVEDGQEGVDRLLRVYDLDDHRQVLGEAQDLGRMDAARMAESDVAAQHRGAAQVHFPRLEHDRFVQRPALVLVVLAEEDAEQDGVARNLRAHTQSIELR